MSNTIEIGDYVCVEKVSLGARLPSAISDIPWSSLLLIFSDDLKSFLNKERWDYCRTTNLKTIVKGDILVFDCPEEKSVIIKRCVGIPGDILNGKGNVWFCNEEKRDYSDNLNFVFNIASNDEVVSKYIASNNLTVWSNNICDSVVQAINLNGRILKDINHREISSFFRCTEMPENIMKNYSNIVIPGRNMKIKLTKNNFSFYSILIDKYEGFKIHKCKNKVYINDELVEYYTFKKDYYLLLGDNRSKSIDSRHFGLIPCDLIIGKAQFVLFSRNEDTFFTWNRFLRRIY